MGDKWGLDLRNPYKKYKKTKDTKKQKTVKNEELEKLKQNKLAIALEKQKSGKKLNLYEARLILESSKK